MSLRLKLWLNLSGVVCSKGEGTRWYRILKWVFDEGEYFEFATSGLFDSSSSECWVVKTSGWRVLTAYLRLE